MSSAYGYKPSLPLAIVGTIVFTLVTGYHFFLIVRQKAWFFWLMLLASMMEVSAFGLRSYSTTHPDESRKFLISYLLLILAPSIMSASLFTTFSRTMWYTTPTNSRKFTKIWFPSGITKKLFNLTYFASFLIEFVGAGGIVGSYATPTSTEPSTPDTLVSSERMLKAGFIMQAICTGAFLITTLHFMLVSRKWQPSTLLSSETPQTPWRKLLWTVNISALLILLRTTYRVFEFSISTPQIKSFLDTHEFTFWLCDALPVFAVFVLLALTHPGHCLPTQYTKFWFIKRKVRKLEKKVMETQSWPSSGWHPDDSDVEKQPRVVMLQGITPPPNGVGSSYGGGSGTANGHGKEGSTDDPCSTKYQSPSWPADAHLPDRN